MKPNQKAVVVFICVMMSAGYGLCGSLSTDYLKVQRDAVIYDEFKVVQSIGATNDAELHYGFSQAASGNLVHDDSLNGNSGTLTGTNAVWSSQVPSGTSGGSYLFNNGGTEDSYIDVSYGTNLQLRGPFTLAAWIKRTVADDTQAIIMKGATANSVEYGLAENMGQLLLLSKQTAGGGALWATNVAVTTGLWYHVAGVVEGSGANQSKIYMNGQLVQQGTLPLPTASNSLPLYVGRWRLQYYYRGYIDEPRIFTRALSASEIGVLYSNGWSKSVLAVDDTEVTITRMKQQGDIGMGTFTNNP